MIPDRLLEVVFGLSFVVVFVAELLFFGYLEGANKQKTGNFNSPKYLGALLFGFLGGVLAETFLYFFSELEGGGGLSWFWLYFGIELVIGATIISGIFYFLIKGAREGESPVS